MWFLICFNLKNECTHSACACYMRLYLIKIAWDLLQALSHICDHKYTAFVTSVSRTASTGQSHMSRTFKISQSKKTGLGVNVDDLLAKQMFYPLCYLLAYKLLGCLSGQVVWALASHLQGLGFDSRIEFFQICKCNFKVDIKCWVPNFELL